ncbi:hypothetical protein SAZ11_56375 [Streptomyces sp. FXJ1.4098]|nr:hypothetical protein [Streptomyces sp. FXJ1.4098]
MRYAASLPSVVGADSRAVRRTRSSSAAVARNSSAYDARGSAIGAAGSSG